VQLTKFEHACFTVEKEGQSLVVDPGGLTTDFTTPEHVAAIIITHAHGDHYDTDQISEIMEDNPDAVIIAPLEITRELTQYDTRPVKHGDSFTIAGFDIDVYGSEHARIHDDLPRLHNIGILIEDRLFYPGDAFTIPEKSVDTLALPLSAPWSNISDVIEYMKTISARFTFPTHDAILSTAGKHVYDDMLQQYTEAASTIYRRIDGDTMDIQ
jgi:L-ascorbate metabolism protein UlaG (beta-lactamase superfamily)